MHTNFSRNKKLLSNFEQKVGAVYLTRKPRVSHGTSALFDLRRGSKTFVPLSRGSNSNIADCRVQFVVQILNSKTGIVTN